MLNDHKHINVQKPMKPIPTRLTNDILTLLTHTYAKNGRQYNTQIEKQMDTRRTDHPKNSVPITGRGDFAIVSTVKLLSSSTPYISIPNNQASGLIFAVRGLSSRTRSMAQYTVRYGISFAVRSQSLLLLVNTSGHAAQRYMYCASQYQANQSYWQYDDGRQEQLTIPTVLLHTHSSLKSG